MPRSGRRKLDRSVSLRLASHSSCNSGVQTYSSDRLDVAGVTDLACLAFLMVAKTAVIVTVAIDLSVDVSLERRIRSGEYGARPILCRKALL